MYSQGTPNCPLVNNRLDPIISSKNYLPLKEQITGRAPQMQFNIRDTTIDSSCSLAHLPNSSEVLGKNNRTRHNAQCSQMCHDINPLQPKSARTENTGAATEARRSPAKSEIIKQVGDGLMESSRGKYAPLR